MSVDGWRTKKRVQMHGGVLRVLKRKGVLTPATKWMYPEDREPSQSQKDSTARPTHARPWRGEADRDAGRVWPQGGGGEAGGVVQ